MRDYRDPALIRRAFRGFKRPAEIEESNSGTNFRKRGAVCDQKQMEKTDFGADVCTRGAEGRV
nr:MAG TPA: hypothetical protein [Caudoviricetes sp.]